MHDFKSLSYSKYADFQKCRRRAKALHIDKIERGGDTTALDRGIAIHDAAERYLLQEADDELLTPWFKEQINSIKNYPAIESEQLWGCNWEFKPSRGPIWSKLDALCFMDEEKTEALVVDYKTGKKYGNEVAHHQQGQLYALVAFLRYPSIERIDVEFWYVDHDIRTEPATYLRDRDVPRLQVKWRQKFMEMDLEDEYPEEPGWWCKWCPISGDCSSATL